jgi:hypothetical protein
VSTGNQASLTSKIHFHIEAEFLCSHQAEMRPNPKNATMTLLISLSIAFAQKSLPFAVSKA